MFIAERVEFLAGAVHIALLEAAFVQMDKPDVMVFARLSNQILIIVEPAAARVITTIHARRGIAKVVAILPPKIAMVPVSM